METNSPNGGQQTQGAQGRQPGSSGMPESQEADRGRGAPQSPDVQAGRSTAAQERPRSTVARGGDPSRSLWGGNPFDTMMRLSREMDQLMESFFGNRFTFPTRFGGARGRSGATADIWSPQIDVRQKGDAVQITAELPGIQRDAIQIEATQDGIAISGERRESREEGGPESGYRVSERSYGSFYRDIPLPEGADVEQARATMRDGVLEVTVPLKPGQNRRRIEISG